MLRRRPRPATVAVEVALAGEPAPPTRGSPRCARSSPRPTRCGSARPERRAPRRPGAARPRADQRAPAPARLSAAAVDEFAAAAGPDSRTELLVAELHHLGGAFALAALGAARDGEEAVRVRIALDQLMRRLAPWT